MTQQYRYYDIILAFYAAMLLISNLCATKLIYLGLIPLIGFPILTDGGGILFPFTYIFDDVLTEVYGYKYARRAIWVAFSVMLLAVVTFTIVRYLPAASDYTDQDAFVKVLGFFPRIVLASLTAYLVGSFMNSYVLAKIKITMKGKHLWVRLIGSTFVGELFDTTIFTLVAFGGILTLHDTFNFIIFGWLFKTGVEVVLLPVTYWVVRQMKKREGVDAYDIGVNFTPFRVNVDA